MKTLARFVATCAALALATVGGAQEPKRGSPPSLPEGAKAGVGTGRVVFSAPEHSMTLLPPDYTQYALHTRKEGLRRYDLATGHPPVDPHDTSDHPVVVSANGKRAVIVHERNYPIVEVETGKALKSFQPQDRFTQPESRLVRQSDQVSLSADGKLLAVSGTWEKGKTGAVIVWDVDAGAEITRIPTPQRNSPHSLLSPDGKRVATWSDSYSPRPEGPNSPRPLSIEEGIRLVFRTYWEGDTSISRAFCNYEHVAGFG